MSTPTSARALTRWCGQALAWLVIAVVVGALAICVLLPRAGGGTPYTVLTSSMEPDYPPGTLVVVRPVAAEDVAVGDVITFQLVSGRPEVATHRVIAITASPDGTPEFVTRGDANTDPDEAAVVPAQLRGELWYAVPVLGRANLLVDAAHRDTLVLLTASGLFGYAGLVLAGAWRDRRRLARGRADAGGPSDVARPAEVDA